MIYASNMFPPLSQEHLITFIHTVILSCSYCSFHLTAFTHPCQPLFSLVSRYGNLALHFRLRNMQTSHKIGESDTRHFPSEIHAAYPRYYHSHDHSYVNSLTEVFLGQQCAVVFFFNNRLVLFKGVLMRCLERDN
uniref:Uncharacterized protein n=1 Tax=Opuntia streptacantha TaxID=393608 RepID=A0A7C8ZZK6_OPUST